MLFAAEWGDLSQLLTLSLVAKYDDPVSVFIGAWGALLAVSGLAVIVGPGAARPHPAQPAPLPGCGGLPAHGMFDRVGDDAGLTPARQAVRDRYLEVNGEHPMTEVDDTYVRAALRGGHRRAARS